MRWFCFRKWRRKDGKGKACGTSIQGKSTREWKIGLRNRGERRGGKHIYEYIDISTDKFLALASDGTYITGTEMRKRNSKKSLLYVSKQNKKNRCGGIVASLFCTESDGAGDTHVQGSTEKSYFFVYDNVSPVISIGVGMDTMMELLKGKNYIEALMEYNGKEGLKETYAKEISERAQVAEYQGE